MTQRLLTAIQRPTFSVQIFISSNDFATITGEYTMPIIVSRQGKNATKLERTPFKTEIELQSYLSENPNCIPLDQITEGAYLGELVREFPLSIGRVDALGFDNSGIIYIIETKLFNNTDKRKVVAQVIEYGAALWNDFSDPEEFLRKLETRFKESGRKGGLNEVLDEVCRKDNKDSDPDELRNSIKRNCRDGAYRYIILMDTVPEHLRNLISFINEKSSFSVYAVEMGFYRYGEMEILIPYVHGAEVRKSLVSPTSPRRQWDEASFLENVKKRGGEDTVSIEDLLRFCKENCDGISWGTGKQTASFTPLIKSLHPTISPLSIYSDGTILVKVSWLNDIGDSKYQRLVEAFYSCLSEKSREKISREDMQTINAYRLKANDLVDGYESIKRFLEDTKLF